MTRIHHSIAAAAVFAAFGSRLAEAMPGTTSGSSQASGTNEVATQNQGDTVVPQTKELETLIVSLSSLREPHCSPVAIMIAKQFFGVPQASQISQAYADARESIHDFIIPSSVELQGTSFSVPMPAEWVGQTMGPRPTDVTAALNEILGKIDKKATLVESSTVPALASAVAEAPQPVIVFLGAGVAIATADYTLPNLRYATVMKINVTLEEVTVVEANGKMNLMSVTEFDAQWNWSTNSEMFDKVMAEGFSSKPRTMITFSNR